MKSFFILWCMLMCLATSYASKPMRGVKHIVLIGLDGWGAYSVPNANMPCVKKLMAEGSHTLQMRSVLPSSSACNWASMFMGASPELHGYSTWGSTKPDFPARELNEHGMFPNIFHLMRAKYPHAKMGYFYEWGGMAYLCPKETMNSFVQPEDKNKTEQMTRDAVDFILKNKPYFTAVIYDNPDVTGHGKGHGSEEYYTMLTTLDACVSRIHKAVTEAGMADETIFIVTADHGGINKGHGGKTPQEMEIPFVVWGKNVRKGHNIKQSAMIYDIASTLAYVTGVEQPQVWIGRPIKEMFIK
ncbi:MAG: alkaline phosphatase [Marinifilaceae bacterium]